MQEEAEPLKPIRTHILLHSAPMRQLQSVDLEWAKKKPHGMKISPSKTMKHGKSSQGFIRFDLTNIDTLCDMLT